MEKLTPAQLRKTWEQLPDGVIENGDAVKAIVGQAASWTSSESRSSAGPSLQVAQHQT